MNQPATRQAAWPSRQRPQWNIKNRTLICFAPGGTALVHVLLVIMKYCATDPKAVRGIPIVPPAGYAVSTQDVRAASQLVDAKCPYQAVTVHGAVQRAPAGQAVDCPSDRQPGSAKCRQLEPRFKLDGQCNPDPTWEQRTVDYNEVMLIHIG